MSVRFFFAVYQTMTTSNRHVHGSRKTLDGNHQLSHFEKNNDKTDVSWYSGNAYFPNDLVEKEYLRMVPQTQKEAKKTTGQSGEQTKAIKVFISISY